MKNWIIVILFLSIKSSTSLSCGYYPSGEDVRYNLLKPTYLGFKGMNLFNYSSNSFWGESSETPTFTDDYRSENALLWFNYFKGAFKPQEIIEAIYNTTSKGLQDKKTQNNFIQFIQKTENKAVMDYFQFAKKCSPLNCFFSDPWEDAEAKDKWKRKWHIKKALTQAKKTEIPELKRRYAYLAIRMAFYNSDKKKADEIYSEYFSNSTQKNALDYWALHFKIQFETPSARKNVEVANVFYHSMEKRYAVHFLYDTTYHLNETLNQAINNTEKGAIYLLRASKKADKALEEIKAFYSYLPNSPELEFLVLREVNKLEDWILTPQYTLFEPSLSEYSIYSSDSTTKSIMLARMNLDRKYAKEVLDWMNSIDQNVTTKFESWQTMKLYVQFMSNHTDGLLNEVTKLLEIKHQNEELNFFNKMLYALVVTNTSENPSIENEILQKTMIAAGEKNNSRFIFTIAREFEFKGNTTEAAILFSKINNYNENFEDGIYWKNDNFSSPYNDDYFEDFFFYLDAQYTPQQVSEIISKIEKVEIKTEFDRWKFSRIIKYKDKLYDLLGTKFVRLDQLENALRAFKNVNDTLWKSEYMPFNLYLSANPFYTNMYNEHKVTVGDTVNFTKTEIIQKLISYKNKISDNNEKKRAYFCFQVANCYLNMTTYGNSWMMRRYYWTNEPSLSGLVDDEEYLQCNLAKKYYLEAERYASNKKFAALSLRMAGRCEEYKNDYFFKQAIYRFNYEENDKPSKEQNKYFKQLKQDYPDHYEPLISNCLSFTEYYKTGNSKI